MTVKEAILTLNANVVVACERARFDSATVKMIEDALDTIENALKEQEPRVLTLEELDIIYNTEKTHVWPFNRPPYLWMTINPDVRLTSGYWICWRDIMYSLENNNPFYVRENYGKAWKIWAARPTDEQQKAVKWDG